MNLNNNIDYLNFSGLSAFLEKLKSFFVSKDEINDLKGEKGDPGEPAGFGLPTAVIDDNIGIPSVTVTASGSNAAKIFNFSFRNLKGSKGEKGDIGTRGSLIYWGNAITGNSTIGMIFSNSEIEYALVNDFYINTDTFNIYQCVKDGSSEAAEWIYQGNIKANDQISAMPFLSLEVKDDGHLYATYITDINENPTLNFEIEENGHLLITY